MRTGRRANLSATSIAQRTTAAAPSDMGHMSYLRRGVATIGFILSLSGPVVMASRETGFCSCATGLWQAFSWFFTAIRARSSLVTPYLSIMSLVNIAAKEVSVSP